MLYLNWWTHGITMLYRLAARTLYRRLASWGTHSDWSLIYPWLSCCQQALQCMPIVHGAWHASKCVFAAREPSCMSVMLLQSTWEFQSQSQDRQSSTHTLTYLRVGMHGAAYSNKAIKVVSSIATNRLLDECRASLSLDRSVAACCSLELRSDQSNHHKSVESATFWFWSSSNDGDRRNDTWIKLLITQA